MNELLTLIVVLGLLTLMTIAADLHRWWDMEKHFRSAVDLSEK